jgi:HD-GYP domain-containing protein (c-di-GMP phosphodiesterase class II)
VLILTPEEARPGMILAAPVRNPEAPEQDLLKRGYTLEDDVLTRLRDLHVSHLFVDYPSLDDLDRHLDANLSLQRQMVYRQIKETVTSALNRTRPTVAFSDYYHAVRDLILTLMSQGQHPIYLDLMSRGLGNEAIAHAAAVAHLSLLLGIRLERYLVDQRKRLPVHHAREVVNLGVGGMLHDMGKLRLAPELQQYDETNRPTDPAALEQWESHARLGYDMIHDGVEASAATAVLHHHQRFDGSGFPTVQHRKGMSALSGDAIHIFARIIHAADIFDHVSNPGGDAHKRSNIETLHILRMSYANSIDPVVMQGLVATAPPFPPASKVLLSDGTAAIVTKVDPADPYHPVVKRFGEDEWTLLDEAIDLSDGDNGLHIDSIGGVKVQPFLPPPPAQPSCRAPVP